MLLENRIICWELSTAEINSLHILITLLRILNIVINSKKHLCILLSSLGCMDDSILKKINQSAIRKLMTLTTMETRVLPVTYVATSNTNAYFRSLSVVEAAGFANSDDSRFVGKRHVKGSSVIVGKCMSGGDSRVSSFKYSGAMSLAVCGMLGCAVGR